jgi:hypothetical protein
MPNIPTLYQLCHWKVTLRYGLSREEIQELIDNPDRCVPTHHQVDPRVIEVHLDVFTAPTFRIGTQEYSLVSGYYRLYYLNWLAAVNENNQSIQRRSQRLQAGLDCWENGYLRTYLYFDDCFLRENYYRRLPTLDIGVLWYVRSTLQAGLDCWENGYLRTYLYFDDCFLRENYYRRLPTLEIGVLWYVRRTPSTIYATAKAIIQLCPHSPMAPLPDFQSLSPEQKEGVYQYAEE